MADRPVQRWHLSARGQEHRVEATGSFTRTITWHVDGRPVAAKRSSEDTVWLRPGDRVGGSPAGDAVAPDLGALSVSFTALGRPKRATWYRAAGTASARALLTTAGIDLEPEPGSPAARRDEQIRRHPRRHTAVAVAGGLATVLVPVLVGLLLIRFTVRIPWPDWDLPSIPWPDWDLPSIPWPDWDLPDWQAPGWLSWLLEAAGYLWPVVLAFVLARREVTRRRRQQALRAELEAETPTHPPAPAEEPSSDCEGRRNGPAGGARRDP